MCIQSDCMHEHRLQDITACKHGLLAWTPGCSMLIQNVVVPHGHTAPLLTCPQSVWENAWLQQAAFSFASERGNDFVDLIRGGTNFGAERMSSGLLTSSGQLAGGPAPMDISSARTGA